MRVGIHRILSVVANLQYFQIGHQRLVLVPRVSSTSVTSIPSEKPEIRNMAVLWSLTTICASTLFKKRPSRWIEVARQRTLTFSSPVPRFSGLTLNLQLCSPAPCHEGTPYLPLRPVSHLLQSTPLGPLPMSECRRYVCPIVCGVGLSEYAVSSLKRSRGERGDGEHRRRPRSTGGSWRADTRVYAATILPIDGDRGSMA